MRSLQLPLAVALVFAVVPALAETVQPVPGGAKPKPWEQIDDDDGIRVWQREIPGSDLPGFRGQVVIQATPEAIARAIGDVKSHTKWMHRCIESTELKYVTEYERVLYNRTDAPWPVWDRDVILEAVVEPNEDRSKIVMRFKNSTQPLKPVPENVVRMPKLVGFYELASIGNGKTKVTYQVEADPGGSLPRWIAERGTRDLPYQTLSSLRDRVTPEKN